jgi:hypothetical protein
MQLVTFSTITIAGDLSVLVRGNQVMPGLLWGNAKSKNQEEQERRKAFYDRSTVQLKLLRCCKYKRKTILSNS